jgi:hypothetical protein
VDVVSYGMTFKNDGFAKMAVKELAKADNENYC